MVPYRLPVGLIRDSEFYPSKPEDRQKRRQADHKEKHVIRINGRCEQNNRRCEKHRDCIHDPQGPARQNMGQKHHRDHHFNGKPTVEQQLVRDLSTEHLTCDDPVHLSRRQELVNVAEDDVHQKEGPKNGEDDPRILRVVETFHEIYFRDGRGGY